MVPPVFYERMAYFYLSGTESTSVAKLVAYKWNELSNEFELKCTKDIGAESTSTNIYHKFSLVNTGADGVIFIAYGLTTPILYLCDPSAGTYTETAVTYDNTAVALTGAQEDTSTTTSDSTLWTLIQAREDPDNYVSETIPDIFGLNLSGYIQKFTWSSPVLSMTSPSIVVPISKAITISAEHVDVGHKYLVTLSPSDCSAEYDVT
jgi:hypothetical protein